MNAKTTEEIWKGKEAEAELSKSLKSEEILSNANNRLARALKREKERLGKIRDAIKEVRRNAVTSDEAAIMEKCLERVEEAIKG